MSARLDGVMVLQTMFERQTTLLCDYSGVEDPTHETMETLDASKVMNWVRDWPLLEPLLPSNALWRHSR